MAFFFCVLEQNFYNRSDQGSRIKAKKLLLVKRQLSVRDFQSYPLVNVYITMENHHFIAGKIHYKWSFSIAMLVHQRVHLL